MTFKICLVELYGIIVSMAVVRRALKTKINSLWAHCIMVKGQFCDPNIPFHCYDIIHKIYLKCLFPKF